MIRASLPPWQQSPSYRAADRALRAACTTAQRLEWRRQRWITHVGEEDTWAIMVFLPHGPSFYDKHGWARSRSIYNAHAGQRGARAMLLRQHRGFETTRTPIVPGFVFAGCLYVGYTYCDQNPLPLPGQMLGLLTHLRIDEGYVLHVCRRW